MAVLGENEQQITYFDTNKGALNKEGGRLKVFKHLRFTCITPWDVVVKERLNKPKQTKKKKQKNACERHRSVGSFVMTSGLSAEPAYVNILNGIVDAWRRMNRKRWSMFSSQKKCKYRRCNAVTFSSMKFHGWMRTFRTFFCRVYSWKQERIRHCFTRLLLVLRQKNKNMCACKTIDYISQRSCKKAFLCVALANKFWFYKRKNSYGARERTVAKAHKNAIYCLSAVL